MKIKYAIFTFLMLGMMTTVFAQTQKYQYPDANGPQGISVVSRSATQMVLNFSVEEFSVSPIDIKGEEMMTLQFDNTLLPNDEGKPNLPGVSHYFALPQGAVAHVSILSKREEVISNIEIAPAPRIPLDTEDGPMEYNKDVKVYNKNAFYPAETVAVSEPTVIRGVDASIVGITPFRYNPVTKELVVIRDMEIEVTFEGGTGVFGDLKYRNRFWDPILNDMLLNADMLPEVDYSKRTYGAKDETGCEYVIITPTGADFVAWADSIKNFRNRQGILTQVFTLEEVGGNTTSAIENFINDAYNNWDIPPAAALLLGDYGDDITNSVVSPIWDSYCVSDNIYADVNNNDMPDVVFARITARNAAELELMINKFLNYEKNPPVSPDFYNHPITALGWQTERWFQICSESVGGYFKNVHGKDPVRINAVYGGNPNSDPWSTATNTAQVLSVFGPDGLGYIPASPGELGGWSGGTATMVTNAINDGAFILQHRDHGGENGWGEPDYDNGDIQNLTNTDLTFVFSINCLTGKYNIAGECFAEAFHRHGHGALGIIAASEVSYSFVNDTYVWGMYDNMWPDFLPEFGATPSERGLLPAFGNAAGKYFLQQSQWPYNTNNKEVTYNLFHHHGDAFLTLYSEVPEQLTVAHDDVMVSGAPTIDVAVEDGAFIALTVNNEIIATGISEGGVANITVPMQLPGTFIDIVITKTNYYRYENRIQVIPPDGAYVIKDSYVVKEEGGNGIIDFGENVLFDVTFKNVGNESSNAATATMTTESEYVTFVNNTCNVDAVPANETLLVEDAFEFTVADDIPDNTSITFMLAVNDGGDEDWVSYIAVKAYAPALKTGTMVIDDYDGDMNGRLDPGETANITISMENTGMSNALEAIATLNSADADITINEGTVEIGEIAAQDMATAQFNITVSGDAEIGTLVTFMFDVTAGNYSAQKSYGTKVGLIVEDFETGDFSMYDYSFGGSADWQISTSEVYEGAYAAKSGSVVDQQASELILEYSVAADDSIHFMYKVSSEATYDFLTFYIDGGVVGSWSGEQGWDKASYPVSEGDHVFKWAYEKDYSVSNGSDCGWIDYILLPAELKMTAYAGADMEVCEGMDCPLSGNAALYDDLLWTTAGDGTFDDATALSTMYYPGANDIEAGSVAITLTVSNGSKEEMSDEMVITINKAVEVNRLVMEDPFVCAGAEYQFMELEALNYATLEWTTSGDGTFDDATLMNPVYTPGAADIEAGAAEVALNVTALGGCENAAEMLNLTIHAQPTAMLSGDAVICASDSAMLTIELTGMAPWTVINGAEETMVIEETPWTGYVFPEETMEYTLMSVTDYHGCTNDAEGVAIVTVNALPVVSLGDDFEMCHNHEITLDAGAGADAYLWSTGETTQTIVVDSTGVGFQGSKEISVEVTSADGCKADDTVLVSIKDCTGIDEAGDMECSVYPNPGNGLFKLEVNTGASETITLRLMDAVGKMILEERNIAVDGTFSRTFDLQQLNAGIYYLSVEGDNGRLVKKVMID
ncbi:MAG: hypothetical protein C0593_07020 [Marinilabiliales bacterium]|nr:MAG: hypothetical protein C0593_07020 [Marinilabiliales bacterium]